MRKYIEPIISVKIFCGENVVTASNIDAVTDTNNYVDENKDNFDNNTATYVLLWD